MAVDDLVERLQQVTVEAARRTDVQHVRGRCHRVHGLHVEGLLAVPALLAALIAVDGIVVAVPERRRNDLTESTGPRSVTIASRIRVDVRHDGGRCVGIGDRHRHTSSIHAAGKLTARGVGTSKLRTHVAARGVRHRRRVVVGQRGQVRRRLLGPILRAGAGVQERSVGRGARHRSRSIGTLTDGAVRVTSLVAGSAVRPMRRGSEAQRCRSTLDEPVDRAGDVGRRRQRQERFDGGVPVRSLDVVEIGPERLVRRRGLSLHGDGQVIGRVVEHLHAGARQPVHDSRRDRVGRGEERPELLGAEELRVSTILGIRHRVRQRLFGCDVAHLQREFETNRLVLRRAEVDIAGLQHVCGAGDRHVGDLAGLGGRHPRAEGGAHESGGSRNRAQLGRTLEHVGPSTDYVPDGHAFRLGSDPDPAGRRRHTSIVERHRGVNE